MAPDRTTELLAALLDWQLAMGATEAITDAPVDRYALARVPANPGPARPPPGLRQAPAADHAAPTLPAATPSTAEGPDLAALLGTARALAAAAADLAGLAAALRGFEGFEIRRGARNFVFADGTPGARVMILGEAPGREEDLEGRPFVGRAGRLLDLMFAAIGLSRDAPDPARGLYIANVLPWRPPGNRTPTAAETALARPFLERHIALADPEVVVVMGNAPALALLGQAGITRLRGRWTAALGRPVLPMTHPAYLLRTPVAKREAWADLLTLQAALRSPRPGNQGPPA